VAINVENSIFDQHKITLILKERGSEYMRNVFEYYKEDDYLAHHGILGQKWGIRRFQKKDGSLTNAGKKRRNEPEGENMQTDADKKLEASYQKMRNGAKTDEEKDEMVNKLERARDKDLSEIDFLEAVQNTAILHNGDTKALLTEYAEYLNDRDAYWERGRKLPPAD
jgi:hypothetical protein